MDEDDVIIAACAATIIAGLSVPVKRRKTRRHWVKSWLAERDAKGAYNIAILYIIIYLRMNTDTFEGLIGNFLFCASHLVKYNNMCD